MESNIEAKEKKGGVVVEEENISVSSGEPKTELDGAGQFLELHKDIDISEVDIEKVRHKVDRNIVAWLCLVFIVTFLDRAIYNVSMFDAHFGLRLYEYW
jgi:hypothetical protein